MYKEWGLVINRLSEQGPAERQERPDRLEIYDEQTLKIRALAL